MNNLGKQIVDLVLSPKWIIPIVPRGSILKNTSIVVNNGIIVDIADRQVPFCHSCLSVACLGKV